MDLKEFAIQALKAKGFNGLSYFDGDGCACHIDDLMPCDAPNPECRACFLVKVAKDECQEEECEWKDVDHFHEAPKPPCKTCGGSKKISNGFVGDANDPTGATFEVFKPCPDCQPQQKEEA